MKILNLCYLIINAWTDGKNRIIDLRYTIIYFVFAGLILVYQQENFRWLGMVPGMFLALLSVISKKQIGFGDGIMVMTMGCVMGIKEIIIVLEIGFLIAGAWGMIISMRKRKKSYSIPYETVRSTLNTACSESIPFAPCLLLGYIVRLFT